ncbi:MAG: FMN-binding protein [Kiritimatiellae bacterium]|nr:FMN-binding protein [Kiritimatiellia bacterium]
MKKDGGEIDAITAATISSRAVMECIRDAIAKYEKDSPQLR